MDGVRVGVVKALQTPSPQKDFTDPLPPKKTLQTPIETHIRDGLLCEEATLILQVGSQERRE